MDEILLHQIQKRDQSALSQLYDTYRRLVYSLALQIVREQQDAEEITVSVFHKVWEKAEAFNPALGSVRAWLTTMTRRLAIDRTRSKQYKTAAQETELSPAVAEAGHSDSHHENPNHILVSSANQEVVRAIEKLAAPHREMIQLAYYEGLSHSKIAAQLDMPLGTVKTRVRDAVSQLRTLLNVKV